MATGGWPGQVLHLAALGADRPAALAAGVLAACGVPTLRAGTRGLSHLARYDYRPRYARPVVPRPAGGRGVRLVGVLGGSLGRSPLGRLLVEQVVSPPLPKGDGGRGTSMTVRLTAEELAAVKRAAAAAGRRQHSRWAREQLLAATELWDRDEPRSVAEAEARLREALRSSGVALARSELARIGSNLNQAVRAANTAALSAARTGQAVDVAGLTAAVEAAREQLARLADDGEVLA